MPSAWPGFVTVSCADCGHPGDVHQPRCVNTVRACGRAEYCGCPAYRCTQPQQVQLFATPGAAP